jgi:hypothetical protein
MALGALGAALLLSCTQDPIFAMISREVEPREPRIKGVPSRMVVFDYSAGSYSLFVGASSLHRYKSGTWYQDLPSPPGAVIDLAATQKYLYALVNADSPQLYRLGKGARSWAYIPFSETVYSRLDAIYGETDSEGKPLSNYLFVGSRGGTNETNTGNYAISYINDTNDSKTFNQIAGGSSFLTGAVYDDTSGSEHHYISTNGGGIYEGAGQTPASFSKITGPNDAVSAMIRIGSSPFKIIALCHNGDVLSVTAAGAVKLGNGGYNFTGPLAVWKQPDLTDRLLLAAVKTSDTYGYREIPLYAGPLSNLNPGTISIHMPGDTSGAYTSTMDDSKHYQDTLEPKPVNAIFQVPSIIDSAMPLFASVQGRGTSKDNTDGGLWSYRWRDGAMQWNAE